MNVKATKMSQTFKSEIKFINSVSGYTILNTHGNTNNDSTHQEGRKRLNQR